MMIDQRKLRARVYVRARPPRSPKAIRTMSFAAPAMASRGWLALGMRGQGHRDEAIPRIFEVCDLAENRHHGPQQVWASR